MDVSENYLFMYVCMYVFFCSERAVANDAKLKLGSETKHLEGGGVDWFDDPSGHNAMWLKGPLLIFLDHWTITD